MRHTLVVSTISRAIASAARRNNSARENGLHPTSQPGGIGTRGRRPPRWLESGCDSKGRRRIVYRGELLARRMRLHYGFDGWQEPIRDAELEVVERGVAVAEVSDLAGHVSLECAVADGLSSNRPPWQKQHRTEKK
jgi:hypothetical protein